MQSLDELHALTAYAQYLANFKREEVVIVSRRAKGTTDKAVFFAIPVSDFSHVKGLDVFQIIKPKQQLSL